MSQSLDTARNASLSDLVDLLRDQNSRKLDVVAPAAAVRSQGGVLVIEGTEPEITEQGVTTTAGRYLPTDICDEGLSKRLGIPRAYLRRMRDTNVDLYDANINGWLDADPGRRHLVRCFRGEDGQGVARALLSDSYRCIDSFDVIVATLDGIRQSGAEITVGNCALTDRRMYVDVYAPGVAALAPVLLEGYRSPFGDIAAVRQVAEHEGLGYAPGSEPVVFAGFRITNSETGGGAATVTPRLVVQVCRNGMTIASDALKMVHLGGKLEEGVIEWTEDTLQKQLALITAQARDAVKQFLSPEYLRKSLTEIETKAGVQVTDAPKTIETVSASLGFTEAEQAGVLDHFIRGGQMTVGGVLNAVTSYAQVIPSADRSDEVERAALEKVFALA